MSTSSNDAPQTAVQPTEDDVSMLDALIVLAKHKKIISLVTLIGTVLGVILSLLLPNIYTATARVLPPQQSQSGVAMLLGQLGGLSGIASTSLGIKNPSDLYIGMLNSRTIADKIIANFRLKELYERDTMVETRQELAASTNITMGKDGLITVEFDDKDPVRAAAVANSYVAELQKLSQSLAVTEAAQRRLFFEQQLKEAKENLAEAEVGMRITQEKTGLIKLDDQGKAIIEAVAALRAQIAAKEVQLRALRTFATDQNAEYMRAQQQLAGLRAELTKLERAQSSGRGDILLATSNVPKAGLEYVRSLRDVKYYETIFELLAKQFEAAKIDEANEAAIIQIVDSAIPPDRKRKPKRAFLVIALTLVSGLAACMWAFLLEARERAEQNPVQAARLAALRRYASIR
jgi:tyrosine-protein kinase Etk/Wzc